MLSLPRHPPPPVFRKPLLRLFRGYSPLSPPLTRQWEGKQSGYGVLFIRDVPYEKNCAKFPQWTWNAFSDKSVHSPYFCKISQVHVVLRNLGYEKYNAYKWQSDGKDNSAGPSSENQRKFFRVIRDTDIRRTNVRHSGDFWNTGHFPSSQ